MDENATMDERVTKAVTSFLDRRGYEILQQGYQFVSHNIDFVCKDPNGNYAFIDVYLDESEDGFPDDEITDKTRREIETLMLSWFDINCDDLDDGGVHYDIIRLIPFNNKAFIRHHINAI